MMDRTRAEEIIAAYGADPTRWPEGERAAVRALLSADLPLHRQAVAAADLDAALEGWAAEAPAIDAGRALAAADAALAASAATSTPDRPRRGWAARAYGGAAAAAVVAALVLGPRLGGGPAPQVTRTATPVVAAASLDPVDHRLWAMTFTPTPEEETLI